MSHERRDLQRLATKGNVGALPERERAVVVLRLGWDGKGQRSQQKVANELGLSQPYVSSLERNAKKNLGA